MTDNNKEPGFTSHFRDYGNLGIEFFSAVLIGTFGGWLIDNYFETKPAFLVLGLVFGAFAGFRNLYSFIKREEEAHEIAKKKDRYEE